MAERRSSPRLVAAILFAGLAFAVISNLLVGPSNVAPGHVLMILFDPSGTGASAAFPPSEHTIVWSLRLPRALLALVVGAGLGAGGAAAQGLFRNPLADPGLVGVASGATLGAAATIVLGGPLLASIAPWARSAGLPIGAFVAGALTTVAVVKLGGRPGRASTATVLLAGVAINAFAGAVVGFLSHVASDAELRNLTFWVLGGFSSASWVKLVFTAPLIAIALLMLSRSARALDIFSMGELDAGLTGVDVLALRRQVIVALALAVGASVAAAGLVGFVGLLVPHFTRMWVGPGHRALLPLSALGGACLVVFADGLARVLVAPAELPVGLLTALVGAPFFLHLLRRELRA
jgi:iron complex transport system permease protein